MTRIDKLAKTYRREKDRPRRIRANWTPELAQDLVCLHNPDAEEELVDAMSKQISETIDNDWKSAMEDIQIEIRSETIPCKKNY